jgi:hypothetical protein
MTGADVKLKFETQIDELYSGYWDDDDLNRFFETAINIVTTGLIKSFQTNDTDTSRLLPLLNVATVANPASNNIDISRGSTEVVLCKQVLFIEPTFNSTSATVRTSQVTYQDYGAIYSTGTVRYPRFILSNGIINISPKTPAVTSCKVWYAREPFYIDVADNTDVIPYNDEMVELIIQQAIVQASNSTREYSMSQVAQNAVNAEK